MKTEAIREIPAKKMEQTHMNSHTASRDSWDSCNLPVGRRVRGLLIGSLLAALLLAAPAGADDAPPDSPRIEAVVPLPRQSQQDDRATIWYDDFDGPERAYTESSGGLDDKVAFGGAGKSMQCLYEKGKHGKGNRKVFFGDSPTGKVVRKGEKFKEIYWRIYVRHPEGWTGHGPDKMSRATSIVSGRWNQAMIAHVWGGSDTLTLDPASGVRGRQVVTTKYNDFEKLHWLGNRPSATFPIHSTAEAGWWVCVEARARLNTPGKKDGLNQLWIDGRLEAERKDLDWRGGYTGHGINAVFLEAYWNKGAPVTQNRWYDNFVISTQPIGPVVCPRNPVLLKTPRRGAAGPGAWEAEVATDGDGKMIVWQSAPQKEGQPLTVSAQTGRFAAPPTGQDKLAAAQRYYCRVRQQDAAGTWSPWSRWHQCFQTAGS